MAPVRTFVRPRAFWRPRPAWRLVALMLVLSTCKSRGTFSLPLDGEADAFAQGTVPTTLHVADLDAIVVRDIPLFERQGLDALDLHRLLINQVGLVMQAPTSAPSFAFLYKITIYVQAEGLPDLAIATGENLPAGTNFAGLDVVDVDLSPYARKGQFRVFGTVDDADAPPTDVTLRLALNLEASIGQPGAACWQR